MLASYLTKNKKNEVEMYYWYTANHDDIKIRPKNSNQYTEYESVPPRAHSVSIKYIDKGEKRGKLLASSSLTARVIKTLFSH